MVKRAFGGMPHGWWDEHVPADLNPIEIAALVDQLTDGGHPMLAHLHHIARMYDRATAWHEPERLYRCPACRDSGFQEMPSGTYDVGSGATKVMAEATLANPIYRQCAGMLGTGCAWRVELLRRAARSKPSKRTRADADSEVVE